MIYFFCAGEIILVPKRVITDIGWLAHIHDREVNVIGILKNTLRKILAGPSPLHIQHARAPHYRYRRGAEPSGLMREIVLVVLKGSAYMPVFSGCWLW
ncbi:MAG: hypothetical protein NTZ39_04285 [Methanoregula sp.]|nr:hypothetical protein [Methanoregula sp.]